MSDPPPKGNHNNKDEDNQSTSSHSKDLVIRDGFPALLKPKSMSQEDDTTDSTTTKKQSKISWWIEETDETMVLPRWPFWSQDDALEFWDAKTLPMLLQDCRTVFSARTVDQDVAAYSAGTTYFLPALMKPRCALEGLVQLIFQQHVGSLPDAGMHKPEQSGAEWWTLVLEEESQEKQPANPKTGDQEKDDKEDVEDEEEEDDEVGWHFDADYGLEDQAPGLLLHPRVGTITYLTDVGAPTVVLDCQSPRQGQVQSLHQKRIDKAWISYPQVGKHAAFDGRLLHGAPAHVFPSRAVLTSSSSSNGRNKQDNNTHPPPAKRAKLSEDGKDETNNNKAQPLSQKQRVTLLVNVWLNHCPLDAELLEDEVLEQLETPWSVPSSEKTKDENGVPSSSSSSSSPLFSWNPKVDMTKEASMAHVTLIRQPANNAIAKNKDDDEALEDEIVLCNRHVKVKYGAALEDYHFVAQQALLPLSNKDDNQDNWKNTSSSLALDLAEGFLTLYVGDPVSSDVEEAEAEEEEEENDSE